MEHTRSTAGRFFALGIASAACMVACGGTTTGGGGGTGSLTGTVAGTSFAVASQVAAVEAASTSCTSGGTFDGGQTGETCTSSGQAVIVILTNRADLTCELAQSETASQASVGFASLDELELLVANATGDVTPGTYPIVAANSTATSGAGAMFGTTSASCATVVSAQAETGTVTLTQFGATAVSGTYDVTFGSQGSFSGSFDIPICVLPDAGTVEPSDGGPPACK
jgi:hypothetical protein